jgi:hypothetical protein
MHRLPDYARGVPSYELRTGSLREKLPRARRARKENVAAGATSLMAPRASYGRRMAHTLPFGNTDYGGFRELAKHRDDAFPKPAALYLRQQPLCHDLPRATCLWHPASSILPRARNPPSPACSGPPKIGRDNLPIASAETGSSQEVRALRIAPSAPQAANHRNHIHLSLRIKMSLSIHSMLQLPRSLFRLGTPQTCGRSNTDCRPSI